MLLPTLTLARHFLNRLVGCHVLHDTLLVIAVPQQVEVRTEHSPGADLDVTERTVGTSQTLSMSLKERTYRFGSFDWNIMTFSAKLADKLAIITNLVYRNVFKHRQRRKFVEYFILDFQFT